MATNIRSTYPTGQSQTTVDPSGPDPNAYLMALLSRERDQLAKAPVFRTKRPPRVGGGGNSGRVPNTARPVMDGPREGGMLAEVETPWYSQQGAATRPTGLGAQMIPGMAADPRLLPPDMRPQSSQFQNPTIGPSMAGVTPDMWQEDFYRKYGYWPSAAQSQGR